MVPGCDGVLGDSAVPGAGRACHDVCVTGRGCKHGAAKGDRQLSPCQGHAAWVPASARLPPGCGEQPRSPASTSSPPPYRCSGHRLLEPGPPWPEASPEHSASEGLSGMFRRPASPPRGGCTPPGPWRRARRGRAPLNRAPPGLGAGGLEASGLLVSSLSCPSACVSVCLGGPCGWFLDTDSGARETRFSAEASPAHPACQPSCLLPLGVGAPLLTPPSVSPHPQPRLCPARTRNPSPAWGDFPSSHSRSSASLKHTI